MSEKIIRTPAQIPGATLECLLLSYNELTGRPIKRFADRATAERRLEMAMLAAQDATAHAGVPKGTTVIVPKTAAELGLETVGTEGDEEQEAPSPRHCSPDWPGMVQNLASGECAPTMNAPDREPKPQRSRYTMVRAKVGGGTSRLQPNSVRNAVMQAILACGPAGAAMVDLDLKFPPAARGHVQKLLASGHVECFNE